MLNYIWELCKEFKLDFSSCLFATRQNSLSSWVMTSKKSRTTHVLSRFRHLHSLLLIRVFGSSYFLLYSLTSQLSVMRSNGNDIEAKRNEASILRHFLYRRETNKLILKLWRIEAKRTKFSPFFTRSKRKRTGLFQNFAGSKRNEPV
jgi:hypothetical protein